MLSSPNDKEAGAAARAICRTLESAGLDIHALADQIGGAGAGADRQSAPSQRAARTEYQAAGGSMLDDYLRAVWLVSCRDSLKHAEKISPADVEFVRGLQERLLSKEPPSADEQNRLSEICRSVGV